MVGDIITLCLLHCLQAVAGSAVPYLAEATEEAATTNIAAYSAQVDVQAPQQQQQEEEGPLLPDDPRWQSVQRSHAAYLSYMQQLSAMVVNRQQQNHQVVYQVTHRGKHTALRHSGARQLYCLEILSSAASLLLIYQERNNT